MSGISRSPGVGQIPPDEIRRRWDERAAKDRYQYIVGRPGGWDEAAFFASGERDYRLTVEPRMQTLGVDPASAIALEIGCGIGRMTRSFAERFHSVVALDVSMEMLRRGRALHAGNPRILWVPGTGVDLAPVASESIDFVYSFLVLQHVPAVRIGLRYVDEMMRVLKPGGAFAFQFRSARERSLSARGRFLEPLIERLHEPVLGVRLGPRVDRLLASRGRDPLKADRTWSGVLLDVRDVLEHVWSGNASVVAVEGWNSPFTWCVGTKRQPP